MASSVLGSDFDRMMNGESVERTACCERLIVRDSQLFTLATLC